MHFYEIDGVIRDLNLYGPYSPLFAAVQTMIPKESLSEAANTQQFAVGEVYSKLP